MDRVNVNIVRLVGLAALVGAAGLAACEPEAPDSPERDTETGDAATEAGAVRGVVRDARTDAPIGGAYVSAGGFSTSTDETGGYVLSPVAGGSTDVRAYLRGFRPDSTSATVRPGESVVVDLSLDPAEPPCCGLEGEWTAEFVLDSAGLNPSPGTRRLAGRLAFRPDPPGDARSTSRIAVSTGTSELDFSSLLDGDLAGEVGTVAGEVFYGDSVAVTLQPRFGDWAVELRGLVEADTVRGDWFQRASCCGAYGHFVLVREQ
ncbi:MAG: carboxypeptidase-like regulatory domain-containing protein [Gemmatimonadota bacterium]